MSRPKKQTVSATALAQIDILEAILTPCELCLEARDHPGYFYVPDSNPGRNQLGFHKSKRMHRVLLGGNQSGKSRAAAQEIRWWAMQDHPHQKTPTAPKIWVISASYTTLEEGIWKHLQDIMPGWEIKRRGQIIPHTDIPQKVILRSGAEIRFISAVGSNTARRKTQAAAIDLLVIDEEVEDVVYEELMVRRLAKGAKSVVSATAVESVEWLVNLEERFEEGDKNVDVFRLDTREAARAGHVDKEVLRDLEAMITDEEKAVRIEGKTRRRQGLVYPEFTPDFICDPFEIPKDWARYMAIDPGWNIFAVLWIAISPDRRSYVYRELYEHATTARTIADKIYGAEGWSLNGAWRDDGSDVYAAKWLINPEVSEPITQRWIDPAEFGSNPGGGLKVGNILAGEHGIVCVPARNDVEYGIEMVRRTLVPGWDGIPRTQIFSTCRNFLKERAKYRRRNPRTFSRDTNERKAAPVKKADHLMDCWRYIVAGGAEPIDKGDPLLERALLDDSCPHIMEQGTIFAERTQRHWDKIMENLQQEPAPPENEFGLGVDY